VTTSDLLRRAGGNQFAGAYDAVWLPAFPTGTLPGQVENRLETGTAVMTSPLVLGLRRSAANRLDPPGTGLTWSSLAAAAAAGRFTFGLAGPSGNAGADPVSRAILLGMATGLAASPDALTAHDVFRVSPQLRALHARQVPAPATSQELTAWFRQTGAGAADGLLAEESRLLRVNAAAGAAAPLTVVVPGGRTASVRYLLRPLVSMNDPSARTSVRRLTEGLLGAASQEWIATRTYRRPAVTTVLAKFQQFPAVREIATPRDSGVIDRAVQVYRDETHYPTRVVFVLDISGSMRGKGMTTGLRRAFDSLDETIATRHGASVQVLLIPFATAPARTVRVEVDATHPVEVDATHPVEVDATHPAVGLAALARAVARLEPGGGTAMYTALEKADDELTALIREGDERVTSIILITDGKNTTGADLPSFRRHRQQLRQERCGRRSGDRCQAPVFPVLVAGADPVEMGQLATLTGGEVHDARTVNLASVLRDLAAGR
jgi:Ca-activated chloride channel family protein